MRAGRPPECGLRTPPVALGASESGFHSSRRSIKIAAVSSFSAVATTGIYCRPGCPARPHPENVHNFSMAAAAEAAGYRACDRCRPYRLDPPIVSTGSELVCRAVRLIASGALDDGSEQELGARL